ncbi:MAG TPA: hypothetical protein VF980_06050 [Thermoanaerobaculia bacterium]
MRKLCVSLALVLAACSSSDYDRPQDQPQRGGGGGYGGRSARVRDSGPMLLDFIPDDAWWRQVSLVEPLHLTDQQLQSLDKIVTDNRDEIARLDNDLPVAQRDLRSALDATQATSDDITAAANRVRNIRDALFDRQVQMLSAERLVLTHDQWSKLLDELRQRREDRTNDRGNQRGGRGGYPRGGRGRPWPY